MSKPMSDAGRIKLPKGKTANDRAKERVPDDGPFTKPELTQILDAIVEVMDSKSPSEERFRSIVAARHHHAAETSPDGSDPDDPSDAPETVAATISSGEWRVLDALEERYVVSGEGVLIADCYADTHLDLSLPDREEYESNARLIAAAPELLRVLRELFSLIQDGAELGTGDIRAVETIIAKAEGR